MPSEVILNLMKKMCLHFNQNLFANDCASKNLAKIPAPATQFFVRYGRTYVLDKSQPKCTNNLKYLAKIDWQLSFSFAN